MKSKLYQKSILVLAMLIVQTQLTFAQKNFFQASPNARLDQTQTKHITKFETYTLRTNDLKRYLLNAPLEFKTKTAKGLPLEIPLPNGTVETFDLFESPILAPAIAAKHPEIKTYAGKGNVHKEYSVRINLTPAGFNAIILGVEGSAAYFEKINKGNSDNLYRTYFSRDAQSPENLKEKTSDNRCGTLDSERHADPLKIEGKGKRTSVALATGTQLRTFRLAMAADAEFTEKKGPTASEAYIALTNYVNNLNAVYRRELSVALQLVSDESIVYTDASTDPYNNENQNLMLDQNQANLDAVLKDGYDIGHLLGYVGGSGGGIAASGSVCDPDFKAQGVSGIGDGTSFADVFDQQLIQHEIGHQFGMSHSYNSNIPVCTTRSYDTSVEPGSGTTIMSYGYTCSNSSPEEGLTGNDDYEAPYAPILNFHTVNYDQAINFINTLSCFTTTETFNAVPVINPMAASWKIPKSTPFSLTGSATDPDAGDVLSYSWEGTNISNQEDKSLLTNTALTDPAIPPFFRSYAPVSSGTRFFPRLSAILDGSNTAIGDKLPSVGVSTTHRLTVRDNNSGVSYENVTVDIDNGSGPFLITNDVAGAVLGPVGSYPLGGPMTVTWSPNNTFNSEVSCTLVDIFLSTDGGLTFPTTLLSAAPNFPGTAAVLLPNVTTSQARIKIAPSSSTLLGNKPNVFFDISNVNFTIGSPLPVTLVSFNATLQDKNSAALTWETSDETRNAGFDIEMSPDARNFVKVGFVEGNGDSKISRKYQYTVKDLAGGNYYFRLKQLDVDGKFEYSQIRSLKVITSGDLLAVYPNPTSGKLRFNPNMHNEQAFSIQIVNQSGKIVLSLPASTGYTKDYELDASALSSGLYHMIITGANFRENIKFVKL